MDGLFTMVLTTSLLFSGDVTQTTGPVLQDDRFVSNSHCMRVAQTEMRMRSSAFVSKVQFTMKAECIDPNGNVITTLFMGG